MIVGLYLKKRTFTNGGVSLTVELEAIGREIAKRCGGDPLAARILGTMFSKCVKNEWLSLQNNKIWDLLDSDGSDIFKPVLKLSFDNLSTPS